ncbi:MAG: hypothetical protein JW959_03060, partial [Pirellulales bacterium]|nr:hypothetical protein [Pirellulales bacterium]
MSDLPAIDGSLDDESRFYALALRYLDGISTAEEERALCDHFRSVPEDRRRFVTICRQVGMLYETLSAESSEDDLGGVADSSAGPFPAVSIAPSYTQHSFGNVVLSYAASAMILCVALLGAWAYRISHDHESNVVNNSRKSTTFGQHEFVVVGRITGMKDCRWSQTGDPTLLGASVSLDRRYALASGLLEITYKSGARVILEGPCTYRVESSAGGFLERGKLAARV